MKAVLIIHDAGLDAEIGDLLKAAGIDCYTKFPEVLGRGRLSEPHLNTEVWPGVNCGTLVVTESDKARTIMTAVRKMRETYASEGVKAFLWEIEDIT